MENIKAIRVSDEYVSRVCGGITVRTHLGYDGVGDIVDEERFQELLQIFNISKDEVAVTSSMSMFGDSKSGVEGCDELSFRVKLPVSAIEQTPYFLALKQKLDYKMAESCAAE